MFRKKLLTLACAAGTLACGACFLPPIKTTPTYPPAPLRDELQGIKTIDLFVDDVSDPHWLDSQQIAGRILGNMNARQSRTHIRCFIRNPPKDGDAVLRITLLKDLATPREPRSSESRQIWLLELTVNATLTAPDGRVLWQVKNDTYSSSKVFDSNDPALIWKDERIWDWISTGFSDHILGDMFYGK